MGKGSPGKYEHKQSQNQAGVQAKNIKQDKKRSLECLCVEFKMK